MNRPVGPTFVNDSMRGAAGATLAARAGERGATWSKNAAGSNVGTNAVITAAGRLRQTNNRYKALYVTSGTPASSNYDVRATLHVASLLAGASAGVTGRTSAAADTNYLWRYSVDASAYQLFRGVAGTYTPLCSWVGAARVGDDHTIALGMRGSEITGAVDGVQRCSATDTAITSAGRPGVRFYATETGLTDTTGLQLDDFQAVDAAPARIDYTGLRLDRTWTYDPVNLRWTSSDALNPFGAPTNFANAALPDNVALDSGTIDIGTSTSPNNVPVNPATPNEIQRQATTYGTYLNRATYTAPITIVAANQSLTPVDCTYNGTPCVSAMRQMTLGIAPSGSYLGGGLPIPDDYVPADLSDTDAAAVFYQPDYVGPTGIRGRMYEAWKLRRNTKFDPTKPVSPSNPKWTAASAGRVVGTTGHVGHYVNWTASGYQYQQPGHPDSTYQSAAWGLEATGLFQADNEISREDCTTGQINHAVGLLVRYTKPGHRWPAQRNDGSQPTWPLLEGMRLRLPPDTPKPAFSNRLESLLFDAAKKYGLVIVDKTGNSVGVRVEPLRNGVAAPECNALLDGVAGYDALKQFPWSRLRVLAPGTDSNPNPTR